MRANTLVIAVRVPLAATLHPIARPCPLVVTFGKPNASDFWFSGHVANAFVIALAARDCSILVKVLAWSLFAFEILLVLAARTHYTIDILGGIFVGYSVHRVSLDLIERTRAHAI